MKKILFFICGLFVANSGYGYQWSGIASETLINNSHYNGSNWVAGDGLSAGADIDLGGNGVFYSISEGGSVDLIGAVAGTEFIDLRGRILSIADNLSGTPLVGLILNDTFLRDTPMGGGGFGTLKSRTLTLDNSELSFGNTILETGNITLNNDSTAKFRFGDGVASGWDGAGKILSVNSGSIFNHGTGGVENLTANNTTIIVSEGEFNAGGLTLENGSTFTSTDSSLSIGAIILNNSYMDITENTAKEALASLTFQGDSTYTGDDLTVTGAITIDTSAGAVGNSVDDEISLTGNLFAGSFEQVGSANAVDFTTDVGVDITIDELRLIAGGDAEYDFTAGGKIELGDDDSTLIGNAKVSFASDSFISSDNFTISNDAEVSITATNNVDMDNLTVGDALASTSGNLTLNTTTAEIDSFESQGNSIVNLTFDTLITNSSTSDPSLKLKGNVTLSSQNNAGISIDTQGSAVSAIAGASVTLWDNLTWNNEVRLLLTTADIDLNANLMEITGGTEINRHANVTAFEDGTLYLEDNLNFVNVDASSVASLVLTDVETTVGGDVTLGEEAELQTDGGSFEVINNKTITMEDNSMISTIDTDFTANDIVMNDGVDGVNTRTAIETTDGSFSVGDITIGNNGNDAFAVIDFLGTTATIGSITLNDNATTTADLLFKNDTATTISGVFNTNGETLTLATDNLTIGQALWSDSENTLGDYDGDAVGQITFNNLSDFENTNFTINNNIELISDNFVFEGTDFFIENDASLTINGNVIFDVGSVAVVEIRSEDNTIKDDVSIDGTVMINAGTQLSIQDINFSSSGVFTNRGDFNVLNSNITSTINNNWVMELDGVNTITDIVNTDGYVYIYANETSNKTTAGNISFSDSFLAENLLQVETGAELELNNLTNTGTLDYAVFDAGALEINTLFSNSGTMIINSDQLGIDQFSAIKTLSNSGTIDIITLWNTFTLSAHETIANTDTGILNIEGSTGSVFTFTNNGNITGGEVVFDGKSATSNSFENFGDVEVNTLTITNGDFNNQLGGEVSAGQVIISSGTFTNNGELHGTVNVNSAYGGLYEQNIGDNIVDYNVNLNAGEYEIDNSGVLTFEGDLLVAEDADFILVDTEFLLEGTMTISEDKTGFSLNKINNDGAIILGSSANALSIGATETFKNNGIITGEREISILANGTWEQNGNSFGSDLEFTNAGDFKFGNSVSHMTIRNSFTNTGTIDDADDVLISLDGGIWIENNDLDLAKVEVSNSGTFEIGADVELDAILEINNGTLDLNDNDLEIANGNLTMKDSVVLMQRDGDNNISVDGNAYLKDVSFDFAGTLTGQRLLATEEITLVSAGGNLLQDNILILNWDDILGTDTIGILSQVGNNLNLKAVDEMNYETIADFSENNNNMAEIMTELQDATARTAGQNQLLMYFATVANNGTPEETRVALEAIRPQNIDASLKTSAFIDSSILNQITNHMESNSRFARINNDYKLPKDSVWFDVSYVSSATDRVADFNEYSTKGGVASFGREIEIANNVFTGGVATFGSTSTEGLSEDGKDSYEIDTQTMALSGYLQYVSKYVSFYGAAGGSMQSHDLERTTFLENKAKADYTMTNYFAKFSGEISVLKNIIPAVFVSQQHLGAIDYTENGADGEDLNVKGEEADLTQAGASLRLQTEFNKIDLKIVPYVKVETKTLISGDEGIKFENSFVAGGSQFENTTNTFDDSSTVISAGVDVFENISATKTSILYQMEQTENTTNHQIGLQMNLMF